ncbi:MAG: ethanolamine ammonia-lyase reactivating factor EutA [Oscillospiraceae bacterium]|nr:ethanolamine ammonia-lyase reactivating factor EutA [Oscillospiraceae bacterium]
MDKSLLSVGLDVGTTTTQLIVSRLQVKNRASSFAVPEMTITQRQICYRSPVHMTPLLGQTLVDGQGIRTLVEQEYEKAGITRQQVDTGAVIITGETSRKENAAAVLSALSDYAGEFVVATAGPDLESALAARGAGAVQYSKDTGKAVLHMDIGGGTSNLALIEKGRIVATGCLNVGGRLLKITPTGKLVYVSPVLFPLTDLRPGDYPAQGQVEAIARILTHGLEMAAGLRPATELLGKLLTREAGGWEIPKDTPVLSFSGGVADCIEGKLPAGSFGDIGPELGQAIKQSLLCAGDYRLGTETIRATVIGAGCHSTQLSGSTVFCRDVDLPVKNLPVAVFTPEEQESGELPQLIQKRLQMQDSPRVVLALPGYPAPSYGQVSRLAQKLLQGIGDREIFVCLEGDMAKALGQSLCLLPGGDRPCLCIDRVHLEEGCYLDVGEPVGPALPVVVKTLILSEGRI